MNYSNQRRHNSPSIPQTPCQTLITPCPNFDPIYQVIFLENSNEWNLSPAKRRILKKGDLGLKRKKGETSVEKLHVLGREKKKEDEIYMLLGEILLKERKEITISCSAKSNVSK
jgi:hypothetical protein